MAFDHFTACEGIYLLSHSVGRMPRRTRAHVEQHFFDAWKHGDPEPWPRRLNAVTEFNQALSALFNSPAAQFCPQVNISSSLSKLLPALPARGERRTLVLKFPDQEQVEARLRAAGVRFDSRLRGLRLSPHIYNSTEEMEKLIACFNV